MKIPSVIWGIGAAGCTLTIACLPQASAAVSDEDFNALKKSPSKNIPPIFLIFGKSGENCRGNF